MFGDADLRAFPWKRWQCKAWEPACPLVGRGFHYWDGSRWWDVTIEVTECPVRLPCMRGRGPEAPHEPLPLPLERRPTGDVVERARRYLAALPPAIAGSGGSTATFHAAQVLVRGFALGAEDALALLVEYNARCSPPWTLHELRRKVAEATRRGTMRVGRMLER